MPGAEIFRLAIDPAGAPRPTLTPAAVERLHLSLESPIAAALVVIEGGDESFCEGLDVQWATATPSSSATLSVFAAVLDRLSRLDRPVAAIVRGPAIGGGAGLAACADFVVATPAATFSLPEVIVGLIPAVVFPHVARRIGVARARLMALGAPPLSAEEALRIGLVDEIASDPDRPVASYARRAARLDSRAIAQIKSLVLAHFTPASYEADAIDRFEQLVSSAPTQARLRRFAAGDAPWGDTELA